MTQKGHLHLICGMAGAGKTTLAKRLEAELMAIRLSPDEWISPLLETPNDGTMMDRIRPTIGTLQWGLTRRLLTLGNTVIWEQGFWHREERMMYLDEAKSLNARVTLHYLDVPVAELKKRIKKRNESLPEGSFHVDPDEIDLWMTWFKKPDESEFSLFDEYRVYRHT